MNDLFWNRCKYCVRMYTNGEGQVCCNWINKPIKELHIKPDDDCGFIPGHCQIYNAMLVNVVKAYLRHKREEDPGFPLSPDELEMIMEDGE